MTSFVLFKITDRSDQIAFPVWIWLHHSLERDWIWRSILQLHLQRNGWSNILIVSDYDLISYLLNKGCLRHCYQIEIVSNCSCFYPYGGQGESYGTNGSTSCNVDITCKTYLLVFGFNPSIIKFSSWGLWLLHASAARFWHWSEELWRMQSCLQVWYQMKHNSFWL